MKKKLSILLVLLLSSILLTACSGKSGSAPSADSKYIGTWNTVKGEFKGEEVPLEEVFQNGEVFILELKEDGSAKITSETDTVEEGTWTENSKGIHVKAGETDTDFTADGDVLTVEIFGFKLILEKE